MKKRGRPPKGAPPVESDLPELLSYWSRASASERGIAIESKFPNRLLQRLYSARREVGGFRDLKLVELENEVWIVKI